MTNTDSIMVAKQTHLLMERLADFDSTNRTLQVLLRDVHGQEANDIRLGEERDMLLVKLTQTEEVLQVITRILFMTKYHV